MVGLLIYGCGSKISEGIGEWWLRKRLGRKLVAVAKKVFRNDGELVTFLSRRDLENDRWKIRSI